MSNFKSINRGVRGLRLPKIGGFSLTLDVALTTVLRTNVLHCDHNELETEMKFDANLTTTAAKFNDVRPVLLNYRSFFGQKLSILFRF